MAIKPIRRMIPMSAIPGTRLENNMIIAVLPRAAVTVFRNIHGSTLCSISSEPFERIIQWIKSFRIASIVTIEDTASHLQRMYSILLSGLEKVRGRMPSLTSLPIMPAAIMKAKLYALSYRAPNNLGGYGGVKRLRSSHFWGGLFYWAA